MKGKKILILGGAGFIGSNLTRKLVEYGADVRVFTRSGRSIKNLAVILDSVELMYGDFMDDTRIREAVQGVDIVIHLISTTFPGTMVDSASFDITSNLIPTARLLEACVKEDISKIIYLSSGGTVYGEPRRVPIEEDDPLVPKSMYGQSKKAIESHIQFYSRNNRFDAIILRVSNPYGPFQNPYGAQGIIPVAFACAIENRTFRLIGDGSAVRDYIYIKDLVDGIVSTIKLQESVILNLSSGQGKSVIEILDEIERVSGKELKKKLVEARQGDVQTSILSNSKACNMLGWIPNTDFSTGIKKTWDWIQSEVH